MGFYEEIAKYYDYIFPVGKDQIDFLEKEAGKPPRNILDIACGSGGYSIKLAGVGHSVTAVDLDCQMVQALEGKIEGSDLNINTMVGDMLELDHHLDQRYHLAFCIGNSVVHLDSEKAIGSFFKVAKRLLRDNGKLIIQIINYDRVIMHHVESLPTIENKEIGLKFERLYRYEEVENKIYFKTILKVDGKEIENEIQLFPLLSDDLCKLLEDAGFQDISLYGNFKDQPYDKSSSFSLVAVAISS